MPAIFLTRAFGRWMRKACLDEADLRRAVGEMTRGLIDANLGGYLFKKRVAVGCQGKRGGARTIVASRRDGRWFFIFGFEKTERDDIDARELKALQALARVLLDFDAAALARARAAGELLEVTDDDSGTR